MVVFFFFFFFFFKTIIFFSSEFSYRFELRDQLAGGRRNAIVVQKHCFQSIEIVVNRAKFAHGVKCVQIRILYGRTYKSRFGWRCSYGRHTFWNNCDGKFGGKEHTHANNCKVFSVPLRDKTRNPNVFQLVKHTRKTKILTNKN